MSGRAVEDLLDIVAEHADRIAESGQLADKDSMRTAKAIAELKATDWATEYETVKPAKPDALGVVKKDSDRRFAEWLRWREEKQGRRALEGSYISRLGSANRIATVLPGTTRATEKTIRPTYWFLGTSYEEKLPQVWATAQELAEAEGVPVNQSHVREAVAQFKKSLGTKAVKSVVYSKKAARDRGKAQSYVRQLFADGDDGEVKIFDEWYRGFRKEHAK